MRTYELLGEATPEERFFNKPRLDKSSGHIKNNLI
jgi:hypothetical protein